MMECVPYTGRLPVPDKPQPEPGRVSVSGHIWPQIVRQAEKLADPHLTNLVLHTELDARKRGL